MSDWTLHLGDCIEGMATLGDGSVDHVITDPPFEAEAHTQQRRVKRGGGVMSIESLAFAPITEVQRAAAAVHIARVTRRWALVFCQIEAAHKWAFEMVKAGMIYKRTCIWVKPDGMPQYSGDRPGMGYETIVACHARGRSSWNGGGSHGVFHVNKNEVESEKTGHQTQKPVALMELLVRLFTNRGETILDPFSGSGSTGVAALRHGRRFVGWELNPEYRAAAERRLRGTREQLDMFSTSPVEGDGSGG